jgi:hypothetical protein
MHASNTSSVTIGCGNHILRFSITVSTNQEIRTTFAELYLTEYFGFVQIPQVIECYETGHWSNKPQIACPNIACWPRRKSHLLRRTPPSTGDSESLAEIKYSLSVVVSGKSTVKKVSSCPLSPAII